MIDNVIQQHAVLLKDSIRMEAYKKALKEVVREGDTVLDIGCGLGILSFLAIKAGASHVHAVEIEPQTFNLAKLIAKNNDFDKKITFHKGISSKLRLKSKVDVIISELFGNLSLNENLLPVVIDARQRLLKDGGRMIPIGTKIWFAPCENSDWQYTAKFLHDVSGIDMLPDAPEADLGFPSVIVKNTDLIANSKVLADIDLRTEDSVSISNSFTFDILKDGTLAGFAGWFEARLTDNISFTTTPSGLTTHWKQGFLPLRSPEKVRIGQKIRLEIEISPDRTGLQSIIGYHYEIKG